MKIQIVSALGSGPTQLAAFDDALIKAGVANYNLIRLSSVVPPSSEIEVLNGNKPQLGGDWGDKLYVVMAEYRTSKPGEQAWAGVGWVMEEGTNKGLLVEHEDDNEDSVKNDIESSLQALMKGRNVDFGKTSQHVVGGTCKDQPICALVIAAFQTAPWDK